jgi:hypothetical protein
MLSRTYYESQKKPIYVTRATKDSGMDLGFRQEVAVSLEEGSGQKFDNLVNQSQLLAHSRAERPMLVVSADQPRLVRKISGNGLA